MFDGLLTVDPAIGRTGDDFAFPDAAAWLRLRRPLAPGHWRLEVVSAPVVWRVELVCPGGAVPLPLLPATPRLVLCFRLLAPAEEVRIAPAAGGSVGIERIAVTAGVPWRALLPDADLGAVRLPPRLSLLRGEGGAPAAAPTPQGWMPGLTIREADAVEVAGDRLAVKEANGAVRLALARPLRPGWLRISGEWEEAPDPLTLIPRVGLAVPGHRVAETPLLPCGARHEAVVRSAKALDSVILRPATHAATVRIRDLRIEAVPWGAVPVALARRGRARLRAALPGPLRAWRERLVGPVLRALPAGLGRVLSRRSMAHRRWVRRHEAAAFAGWLSRPVLRDGPLSVAVLSGPEAARRRTVASLDAAGGAVLAPEGAKADIVLPAGTVLAPFAVEALRRVRPGAAVIADSDEVRWGLRHSPERHAGFDRVRERYGAAQPRLAPAAEGDGAAVVAVTLVLTHRDRPAQRPPQPPLPRPAAAPGAPLVSVIAATRDAPALLEAFLASLGGTRGVAFETLLVDNATADRRASTLLRNAARNGVRVLSDARPFNFASLNNVAARQARGAVLVFANNDVTFPDPDWLAPLAAMALEPGIGCAGARLLYPDRRVQHAGLCLAGEWGVRHLERGAAGTDPGAAGRLETVHAVSAVSAALMAIRKDTFDALDGFDPAFPVRYNDIDLCLRAGRRGLANVLVPQATAIHHESASIARFGRRAGRDKARAHQRRMERILFHERWNIELFADPRYPEACDPRSATFMPRP